MPTAGQVLRRQEGLSASGFSQLPARSCVSRGPRCALSWGLRRRSDASGVRSEPLQVSSAQLYPAREV